MDWALYGLDYGEQRISPLDQIDRNNIADLDLAWSFDIETRRGVEATPLVVDGLLYVTGSWSVVYALEAKTGALAWSDDPEVPRSFLAKTCCDAVNRGVAYHPGTGSANQDSEQAGRIFVGTIDGRLPHNHCAPIASIWARLARIRPKKVIQSTQPKAPIVDLHSGGRALGFPRQGTEMTNTRAGMVVLLGLIIVLGVSACAGSHMTRTPAERALWMAAENGNPEAQRRVALDLSPDSEPGGARADAGHAAFWFRAACEQQYANAAVDFYEFAENYRLRTGDARHLDHALPCLQSAIEQGHQGAIIKGATRAELVEKNYERAFFLYSLMAKKDPVWADQRWKWVGELSVDAPDRLHRRAARWHATHRIKDNDDFLREQSASRSLPPASEPGETTSQRTADRSAHQ